MRKFFQLDKPIGRTEFAGNALLYAAAAAAQVRLFLYFALAEPNAANRGRAQLFAAVLLVVLLVFVPVCARRLRDLGKAAWRAWLYLLPVYNLYLLGVLFICRGTLPPDGIKEHNGLFMTAALIWVVAFFLILR